MNARVKATSNIQRKLVFSQLTSVTTYKLARTISINDKTTFIDKRKSNG